jgi:hypothetical protein
LEESIPNLNIQSWDGVPNRLFSEKIYKSEIEIGIDMPIDRLTKISRKTMVLIGVNGCVSLDLPLTEDFFWRFLCEEAQRACVSIA